MKFKILTCLILVVSTALSQDLPINPQTGLISIRDSIEIKGKSLQDVKDVLSKWGFSLLNQSNVAQIFKTNSSKEIENISVNLIIAYPHTIEKGNNHYVNNGTMSYTKAKEMRVFSGAMVSPSNGLVKLSLVYHITPQWLVYEFTNLEFSKAGVYYGKFEDEKPPRENMGLMSLNKSMWKDVKVDHFNRIKTLSANFKEFVSALVQTNDASSATSPVNYDSYKKIAANMSYDEIQKLLGGEGKEVSNSSSQLGGKSVVQQTIIWYDLDKSKNITVSFVDGKVTSKSQNNL